MSTWHPKPLNRLNTEFGTLVDESHPEAHHGQCLDTLMLNVGLRCNLRCELCHQSSSPERTEVMSRSVMHQCAHLASDIRPKLIDITGGEPTLWPHLREFVTLARATTERMRVRTNLDALLLPETRGVAEILADNDVEILASLPEALECRTIGECVEALQMLTKLGYGDPAHGARLPLDIAYNPLPGELVRPQEELAREFYDALSPHGVHFRELLAIGNVPLGGFAEWLEETGERERYRATVREAFNPDVLPSLACRRGIEVAWDGTLWDCDFNLAARIGIAEGSPHVADYIGSPAGQIALTTRRIAYGDHCFVCAAGRGTG